MLYFKKLESLSYILPPTAWVYLNSNFSTRAHFGHSRSSKVIDFGTNRKRICDFLLGNHSNRGPILHRFGDIAGFGAPDSAPIPPFWGSGRITVPERHGLTDGRTDRRVTTYCGIIALCVASCGKNMSDLLTC